MVAYGLIMGDLIGILLRKVKGAIRWIDSGINAMRPNARVDANWEFLEKITAAATS